MIIVIPIGKALTPLHSKQPKLYGVLAVLSAVGLNCQAANLCLGFKTSLSVGQTYPYVCYTIKIGTPEIITIIVLQLEQLDFTVQYCVQKMQTE